MEPARSAAEYPQKSQQNAMIVGSKSAIYMPSAINASILQVI
jgi:hypothetical protein